MINWKTNGIGILCLVIGGVLFYTGKITWDQFIIFLGIGGIGLAAKDHNVTGGTKEQ
jgi:hypothetical protein